MAVEAQGSWDRRSTTNAHDTPSSFSFRGLTRFTEWKQELVALLINNPELMKLLYYDTDDALSMPPVPQQGIDEMVGKGSGRQIYQYRHISNLAKNKKSYLSIDFSYFKPLEEFRLFSKKYISGYLYIYILCDEDILDTNHGVRPDLILKEVYQTLEGTNSIIGLGELTMETMLPLWVDNNSFGGYTIGFKVSELK